MYTWAALHQQCGFSATPETVADVEWRNTEIKHWTDNVRGHALQVVCFGLLFKVTRLYFEEDLPKQSALLIVAAVVAVYFAHRSLSLVRNPLRLKVGCYVILECVQCLFYSLSIVSGHSHSITNAIASSVMCLLYQVNIFSSKIEVVIVLTKHFLAWYAIARYYGHYFFPFGVLAMVTFAALQTNAQKQSASKEFHMNSRILREQEAMMSNLLHTIPDGVVIFTEKCTAHQCNKELFASVNVHSPEEFLIAMAGMEYEPDMKGHAGGSDFLLEDVKNFIKSSLLQQNFGTTKVGKNYLEWRGSRCMWKDMQACILMARNSTNWIRMQEKMKMESAYKSSLIRSVSHELRTPTNAIINLSQQVSSRTDIPENCREDLELVRVCSHFLLSMINDLLDFSKVLAGKFTLVKSQFDLGDELKHVYRLFVPQCKVKGLELKLNIDPTLPKLVCSDPTRFKQVLLNLLSNAVK